MNFSEIKTLIAGSYFVVADAANPVISRYYTREGLSPALDTCTIAGIEPIGCLKKSLFEDAAPDEYGGSQAGHESERRRRRLRNRQGP